MPRLASTNLKEDLATSLNRRLSLFSAGTGLFLAMLMGLLVGTMFIFIQSRHQDAMLHAIDQNISSLAQNADYREIERVLSSFLEAIPKATVVLVREGVIQVSLPDIQKMLLRYQPVNTYSIGGITLGSDGNLYSQVNLQDPFSHSKFGQLILQVPSREPLINALICLILASGTVSLLLLLWRKLTRQTLTHALAPLYDLRRDIVGIGKGQVPQMNPENFDIKELAEMSALVHDQHHGVIRLTQTAAKAEGERRAKEGVYSLMHDLLNPYTAVSNLVQARIMYPEDREIQNELSEMWPVLNRQIKDLFKSARHAEVETIVLEQQNLLETTKNGAKNGAVKNPTALKLHLDLSSNGSWMIAHDSALLSRAVANLVRNSVEEGSSQVEVWCERTPLSIHIRDNGPGIPDSNICQLFEGRLRSTKPEGSGIGFPTALRLVQLHQGKILLEKCAPGKRGAHFRIDLTKLEAIS